LPRHFGDFQTPPELVAAVLDCLKREGKKWNRALEPTCGSGQFIAGLLDSGVAPREIQGIEIQDTHLANARQLVSDDTHLSITQGNLFNLDLRQDLSWKESGSLLVIGNPPWVTNSELSALGQGNLPEKTNFKGLRGLDAMTGSSNFDIAEYIWLKLIKELADQKPTIALLCKTSVARNVLKYAADIRLPICRAVIRRIDAKQWFGANVDACLFIVEVGAGVPSYDALVYADLTTMNPERVIGIRDGNLFADVHAYVATFTFARENELSLTWRQGLKHDAARVMELIYTESGELHNKLGETVAVEPEYIFPLLKSADLFNGNEKPRRAVIVTQRYLKDDTSRLKEEAPNLWRYLTGHAECFAQRKSIIYKSSSRFSMFGIGDYSFAPHKVGISGMYKTPRFQSIGPVDGRPVMLDDTCYFAACESAEESLALAELLNSHDCLNQIQSMSFTDSKRPITKKLLQRLNVPGATHERLRISDEPEGAIKVAKVAGLQAGEHGA